MSEIKCPKCKKKDNVVKVIYGIPSSSDMTKHKQGKIKLGGCCIQYASDKKILNDVYCKKCQKYFNSWEPKK